MKHFTFKSLLYLAATTIIGAFALAGCPDDNGSDGGNSSILCKNGMYSFK